jgi:hypothetical protein
MQRGQPQQIVLDELAWGNPSLEDVQNMEVHNYLDVLLPMLQNDPPFYNTSAATRAELNQLVEYSKTRMQSARRNIFDGDLVPYINELFIKNGIGREDVCATTENLVHDLLPLITKLKYHYQRPRPFQLAYYHGLKFFPCFSKFVSSPSYPSGHTTLCLVISEVLATHYSIAYPTCYEVLKKFSGEVMESRLYMGVHYASDNKFACKVAQMIIDNIAFREKYEF